jgi:hypothetical protein
MLGIQPGEVRMSLPEIHDSTTENGWTLSPEDGQSPDSGEPKRARSTWLKRLLGAVLRAGGAGGGGGAERRAIRRAAESLERDGAAVFANVEGWPRPPVVQGFLPDVYAVFADREVVLDLAGDEGAAQGEAERRREIAFEAWAEAASRRVYEQIVVAGARERHA